MRILVDADACPVIKQVETVAKRHGIAVLLMCDTNHILSSDYSEIQIIGAGADAVDFALINRCQKGDIVVTQDYGLACLALGKGARPIHQSGKIFTDENIDMMLIRRHITKEARMSSSKKYLKGPKKRKPKENKNFEEELEKLIIAGDI